MKRALTLREQSAQCIAELAKSAANKRAGLEWMAQEGKREMAEAFRLEMRAELIRLRAHVAEFEADLLSDESASI